MKKYRVSYSFTNDQGKKDWGYTEYESESPKQALKNFSDMFEYEEPLKDLELLSAKELVEVDIEVSEEDLEELKQGKNSYWEFEKGNAIIVACVRNGDYMPF